MLSMLYSVPYCVPYCVPYGPVSHTMSHCVTLCHTAQGCRAGCVGNGSERSLAISFWPWTLACLGSPWHMASPQLRRSNRTAKVCPKVCLCEQNPIFRYIEITFIQISSPQSVTEDIQFLWMATAIVQALIITVTWSETMDGVTGRADWNKNSWLSRNWPTVRFYSFYSHCDVMVLKRIQNNSESVQLFNLKHEKFNFKFSFFSSFIFLLFFLLNLLNAFLQRSTSFTGSPFARFQASTALTWRRVRCWAISASPRWCSASTWRWSFASTAGDSNRNISEFDMKNMKNDKNMIKIWTCWRWHETYMILIFWYIYILIVLMHMVQILNISDKTAISTISSLCNDDPTKNVEQSRPLINPGRGWSSLATPVTFFVSWPVWWFASTACRKSLVPTGFASAARKKLATGRDLVEPGNHVEDLLHFPNVVSRIIHESQQI